MCLLSTLCAISINLLCNIVNVLNFDPTPGIESVCKDITRAYILFHLSFHLIWYASWHTIKKTSWHLTPPRGLVCIYELDMCGASFVDHLCYFFFCFCYAFICVCLVMPCGYLLGKGWPLGSRLWCLIVKVSISHWYPGSGLVLDCIYSWFLSSFLLWIRIKLDKTITNASATWY